MGTQRQMDSEVLKDRKDSRNSNSNRMQQQRVGVHDDGPKPKSGGGGVQISLLYPSTLGSADFDYHVGDRVATPFELHATQFTEVALIMPYSCVPTDYARSYAAQPYTVRCNRLLAQLLSLDLLV